MVDYNVTIDGNQITNIFSVEYNHGQTDSLGKATVVCGNTNSNRIIGSSSSDINQDSGQEMKIYKNGTLDFRGYVTGKPTKAGASKTELEIEAQDKRMILKHQQVNRVFYQTDIGEIIRKIISERLSPFTFGSELGQFITRCEDASQWDSDIPKTSTGSIVSLSLEKQGGDFMFFGWPEGSGGINDYSARYPNVDSSVTVGDGQVDTFYTRLAINNNGGIFEAEVDLRDDYGNNYIWELDLPESGFKEFTLKAEDAVTEASIGDKVLTDLTLEYRFSINGTLAGGRGCAIDYASAIPYRTDPRDIDIDPGGVSDTGNVITRRIERSAFETIKEFAIEEDLISYLDINDTLFYEPSGSNQAQTIDYSTTNVVEAEFNRDYEEITNKVTVQGDDDIRVTIPQPNSIDFYGVSAREEAIVDKSIQTEIEAERRGRGYLSKNAWNDEAFSFVIANTDFQSVNLGDNITVDWPPENIFGTFQVSDTFTDSEGLVTINLTKRGTL